MAIRAPLIEFRHRISGQIAARIQEAREIGQLEVLAGRVKSAEIINGKLQVTVKEKGKIASKTLNVQRIVNCTGPQTDYQKIKSPLIQSLLAQNLILPDELRLGLKALPDGRLIMENGLPSYSFFTIGTTLRGALWESTAVPEISEQAAHLAQTVLHAFQPEPETKTENTKAQTKK